jgi:hypothetical protein
MSENKNAKTPADGPVAWGCQCGRAYTVTCISSKPPKREWVGLTDEEREFLLHQALRFYDTNAQLLSFIKTVEAKLKEKNHG